MWRAIVVLGCLAVSAPLLECQEDTPDNTPATFSADQLDNLLAPIALYPDPLLAQMLVAATFPDQIDEAARFVRGDSDPADIDDQSWDVSVKAVAHYPEVLSSMADSLDWTTALGEAYAAQPCDVMDSIQRLRTQARAVGNLESGPQQEVVDDTGNIQVWPAQADSVSVPQYDPDVAYFGSGAGSAVITFTITYPLGAWLNCDFDWRHRHILYHGWDRGPGWVLRSRPTIHLNRAYVDRRFDHIRTGQGIRSRPLNYAGLDRYQSVHRDVTFHRGAAPGAPVGNQVMQRNINTGDTHLDAFRGRRTDVDHPARPAAQESASQVRVPQMHSPMPQPPPLEHHHEAAASPKPQMPAPPAVPVTPHHEPEVAASQPAAPKMPEIRGPGPKPSAPEPERPRNDAFGGNRGPFDPQAASQRGQASRSQVAQPAAKPAVQPARVSPPARSQ